VVHPEGSVVHPEGPVVHSEEGAWWVLFFIVTAVCGIIAEGGFGFSMQHALETTGDVFMFWKYTF
jgi:hypothetical protein